MVLSKAVCSTLIEKVPEHLVQSIDDPLCMGESFQDYSWIQDFETDFP